MKNKQHEYILKAFINSRIPMAIRRYSPELIAIDSFVGILQCRRISIGKAYCISCIFEHIISLCQSFAYYVLIVVVFHWLIPWFKGATIPRFRCLWDFYRTTGSACYCASNGTWQCPVAHSIQGCRTGYSGYVTPSIVVIVCNYGAIFIGYCDYIVLYILHISTNVVKYLR